MTAAATRCVTAVLCVLAAGAAGLAQDSGAPSPAPAEPPAAEAPAPGDRPGFFDALGRFLSGTQDAIGSSLKTTQDSIGNLGSDAAGAARDAAIALPAPRIVTGRQACPRSSNGAPDCQQGVEALCKGKGLRGGKLLEVTSGQHCSTKAWVESGFKRKGICRTETYVTRAVCH